MPLKPGSSREVISENIAEQERTDACRAICGNPPFNMTLREFDGMIARLQAYDELGIDYSDGDDYTAISIFGDEGSSPSPQPSFTVER